eukprot:scaffold2.g7166.t1
MVRVRFEVRTASGITRLALVGNCPQLGSWDLACSLGLSYEETGSNGGDSTLWSAAVELAPGQLPLRFKCVANGHRSSPNTRPLIWDRASHVVDALPEDGIVRCEFEPTADNSGNGWVTEAGVGAFQLRVGQPPGSTEPLVSLEPHLQQARGAVDVSLWEAKGRDPTVPEGKLFARISCADVELPNGAAGPHPEEPITFLLNTQSIEELAFRVDVASKARGGREDGRLIARCFVSHQTLASLEGVISATLMTPELEHAGTFRAAFLVVTALGHPANHLGDLQRSRWMPDERTLDVGHRGSGATKHRGHSVRENTLLSFQKAATNHSELVEFDVHLTADGEIVIFHDFQARFLPGSFFQALPGSYWDGCCRWVAALWLLYGMHSQVSLRLGSEMVKLPIPSLTYEQLRSPDFTQYLAQPQEELRQQRALDGEKHRAQSGLRRTMSSAEDWFRTLFKPSLSSSGGSVTAAGAAGAAEGGGGASRWLIPDRVATLREVFRTTPRFLGLNIELKYPTAAEVVAMRTTFYSRNHFVDAVLRVVLEEAQGRKVVFSTFDPDVACLLRLKQPRYPVFFLTCGGTKHFSDPRMNSLEAALQFAISSQLQGVVAESRSVLGRLGTIVPEFHRHGLFLWTWLSRSLAHAFSLPPYRLVPCMRRGDENNNLEQYRAQRDAGVDAIIYDDIAKVAKATNKTSSLFLSKQVRSPGSFSDLDSESVAAALERMSSSINVLAFSPVGSPPEPASFLIPAAAAAAAAAAAKAAVLASA